jgi:hypothetical protein
MKNIKDYAVKAQLIEIKLDDATLIETYGEPITFYTYDVISLSKYFDFYHTKHENQFENLEKILRSMVLDNKGKPVLNENEDLPVDIAAAALSKISDILGKSHSKTSTSTVGEQQK